MTIVALLVLGFIGAVCCSTLILLVLAWVFRAEERETPAEDVEWVSPRVRYHTRETASRGRPDCFVPGGRV